MHQKFFTPINDIYEQESFMQKIFKFDLTKEEDRDELEVFENAFKNQRAIEEVLSLIRKKLKYEELSKDQVELLELIRNTINDEII